MKIRGYLVRRFSRCRQKGYTEPIMEHRAVMEDQLGRPLTAEEVVHHIDVVKDNNDPSNLHLFASAAEHRKAHLSLEALIPVLLAAGVVQFNRETGRYELTPKTP